jgi:hypothetical protein
MQSTLQPAALEGVFAGFLLGEECLLNERAQFIGVGTLSTTHKREHELIETFQMQWYTDLLTLYLFVVLESVGATAAIATTGVVTEVYGPCQRWLGSRRRCEALNNLC